MEAIDYKKLLREERKRLKNKKSNQSVRKQTEDNETEAGNHNLKKNQKRFDTNVNPDYQEEAIDYKRLLRDERERLRDKKSIISNTNVRERNSSFNDCRWDFEAGFLSFRNLALRVISEDPQLISYSPTALGQQTPLRYSQKEDNTYDAKSSEHISPEEALMNWLERIPSGDSGLREWKTMTYGKRRVCMFGEEEACSNIESPQSLPPPLNDIAREMVKQNIFPSSSPPNHVLLNEYQPGQGILPHTDGPLYLDRTATLSLGSNVVIEFTKRLSSNQIGRKQISKTIFFSRNHIPSKEENIHQQIADKDPISNEPGDEPITVLLESGSLLVFEGDAYMNYCHGIEMDLLQDVTTAKCLNAPAGRVVPRGFRYSLTFRHKKPRAEAKS